ncbi:MAG: SMC-Scp complex subunit ScpB [Candidatus Moraniibacteriota bacterium]|nr:MAG: SMC-Scp complex subunit ScpB [Candidatus Moranbacteria bacterium]
MKVEALAATVEAILFVSGDPVSIARLRKFVEADEESFTTAIALLAQKYAAPSSGLSLLEKDGSLLLETAPEKAESVERFFRLERDGALSRAALETLSIVAYRGPVSHAHIESIRGVNSSLSLRTLLLRGLVEREENPGDARGYVYSVSFSFLETLGLTRLSELPRYEELSKDARIDTALLEDDTSATPKETAFDMTGEADVSAESTAESSPSERGV